ncbi:dienelactone hydrolase family protein, partial [Acinetobacter baumannii]
VGQTNEMNPKHPIDVADQIKVPVLGLYGAADTGIPVDSVNQMKDKLKASGNTESVFEIYAEAPHAFHADYRPSYRKAAAEDGWAKATAWFK